MLLAARDARVRRFIYPGSATAYGNLPPPHREDGPLQFLNAYALTNRTGEEDCLLLYRKWGVPAWIPGKLRRQNLLQAGIGTVVPEDLKQYRPVIGLPRFDTSPF